jgi:hypothetical protein
MNLISSNIRIEKAFPSFRRLFLTLLLTIPPVKSINKKKKNLQEGVPCITTANVSSNAPINFYEKG